MKMQYQQCYGRDPATTRHAAQSNSSSITAAVIIATNSSTNNSNSAFTTTSSSSSRSNNSNNKINNKDKASSSSTTTTTTTVVLTYLEPSLLHLVYHAVPGRQHPMLGDEGPAANVKEAAAAGKTELERDLPGELKKTGGKEFFKNWIKICRKVSLFSAWFLIVSYPLTTLVVILERPFAMPHSHSAAFRISDSVSNISTTIPCGDHLCSCTSPGPGRPAPQPCRSPGGRLACNRNGIACQGIAYPTKKC